MTTFRLRNESDRDFSQYIETEFVQRLDGLEVVSKVASIHGYQPFGINVSAFIPLIKSHIPFLQEAAAYKAAGLTTIKAGILSNELGETARDINSFIILDAYYLGGLLGVGCAGFAIGLLAGFVDKRIGLGRGKVVFVGMVSIAMNLLILEREMLGMAISIVRDFVILLFAFTIIFINIRLFPPLRVRVLHADSLPS